MTKSYLLEFMKINFATRKDHQSAIPFFNEIGYTIIKYFDIDGAQGYLAKKDNKLVLSFRGTQRSEQSDVAADFDVIKVKEGNGNVHRGFQQELNKLWESITKELANHLKDNILYITGHSLGAAMATIAAYRLQDKVDTLITFGSPRAGDIHFVNQLNVKHYRVQNTNDCVCWLPPWWIGFIHHGENIYIDYYGNLGKIGFFKKIKDMTLAFQRSLQKKEYFSFWYDHRPSSYIKKLT